MAEVHVSIGLIGFGAVGKAFAEKTNNIVENRDNFRIHAILVRDTADKSFGDVEITSDADWFTPSWGHNMLVDASTYCEETKNIIISSLKDGKDLITCSKELVAKHWRELLDAAKEGNSKVYFNSIPASPTATEFADVYLTSDNFEEYADSDLYSYRGAGPEVTADFLFKEVETLLIARAERHRKWKESDDYIEDEDIERKESDI